MADQETNYTTINNDVPIQYDKTVINNPDWVTIAEVAKLLELGDRQIRNKCTEFKWDKRYAKVGGRPTAYIKKSDVMAYAQNRGPFITHEEATVVSDAAPMKEEHFAENNPNINKNTPETALKPYRNTPEEFTALLANLENKLSPQIASFVETHKKVVEELSQVNVKNTQNEKKVTFWRTSLFWMLGIAIVLVGGFGTLWFTVSSKAGELAKSNTELSTSLATSQKEAFESKLLISKKENEILKLKHAAAATPVQAPAPTAEETK